MKYSIVTCGQCGENTTFVVCEWPPTFFWCRYCHSVFTFKVIEHSDGLEWQLKGFPQS